ncbi:hypothetical protein P8C59_007778 [Phyllachora maydis]|uniref:BRCT domain-containing protein n=1 Tax=Phyllachora maydis TaxID=1825666 RepID=A0AAD9I9E5_9PEZI|nr:hypothetical protein P8C59_007778 [Phyllachora maydis]
MATETAPEKSEPLPLFDSCTVAFVPSKALAAELIDTLAKLVTDYGGDVAQPDGNGRLRLSKVTHVVAESIDFEQYTESQARMIPVVAPAWIRSSVNKGKQAQLRPYSPDPRMIFSNVVLTCADIPPTDKESIIGAVMVLGGVESKDLSRLTTHVCALTLDHPKVQEARRKLPKCKIVLPHWFDDCFKLGKRISEEPYLLPNPTILQMDGENNVSVPQSQHVEGATSFTPNTMLGPDLRGSAREKLVVFSQKKVLLSADLPIAKRLRMILCQLIASGDGTVVDEVDDCDMFICQYRDGPQYIRAAQAGKDVGNLSWLYHIIVHNQWTSPLRRLLHYPIPRNGLPGFRDFKIALSNYGGEARIYLENLVVACGATYTKTMKNENTHLITARKFGEKCEAAQDWNINILNHLWIEESYAQCEVQTLTNPKYIHFPPRTNLGEVIGQTFFNETRLHEVFYPGGGEDLDSIARRKRKINDAAQENIFTVGGNDVSSSEEPSIDEPVADTPSVEVVKPGKPNRGAHKRINTSGKAAAKGSRFELADRGRAYTTPAKKHVPTGKENDTPSVISTASRSAKTQAINKLQDLAPDIALYEKEKKRSLKDTHAPFGGKRATDKLEKSRAAKSSSPSRDVEDDDDDDDDDDDNDEQSRRPTKRQKSLPAIEMRVCLTGYKRWVSDKHKEDAERRKLRAMGIQVVTTDGTCDYIAAPRVIRTMKFLRALAHGAEVINSSFVDECLETGQLARIEDHPLNDGENEERFGVCLQQAVARARKNNGKLLWKVPIYCTQDINNGIDSFRPIAEANGAIFKPYSARSGTTIRPTTAEEDAGSPPEPVYLLSSTSPIEKKLWPKFEEMDGEDGEKA